MRDFPVIKFTLLFIVGILSAHFFILDFTIVITAFIVTSILFLLFKKYRAKIYSNGLIFISSSILIFSLGNFLAELNGSTFNPVISEISKVKNTSAFGEIDRIDLIRNNELAFYLSTDSMSSDEFFIKDKFLLLCKVKSDNTTILKLYNQLKPGNYLELEGYYYKGREEINFFVRQTP